MTAKELRALRAKLVEEAQALIPADGKMTSEVRTKVESMLADAKAQAEMISVLEAEETRAAETRGKQMQLPNVGENGNEKNLNVSFRNFLRTGETRDLTLATTGVVVPSLVSEPVIAKKSAGSIYDIVNKMVTDNGNDIAVPLISDTANGFVLNSAEVTTTDPTPSSVALKVDAYRSNPILIDKFLMTDLSYDIEGVVMGGIYERYLRDVSKHMTLGNSSNVAGLVSIDDGVTSAAAAAIAYADFVGLMAALDPAYAANAVWTMNNKTLGAALQILDANDRPLFLPYNDNSNGFAGQILGFPVVKNQYLPDVAADKVAVQFGDFKAGYTFREVGGLTVARLDQRYADVNKIGYVSFVRFGGAITDAGTHPILSLTQKSAS